MAGFRSLYRHGFARVAACTLPVVLADPLRNAEATAALATDASASGAVLAVFPELGLTGYAIDDLRQQDALLDAAEQALALLLERSRGLLPILVVGLPVRHGDALFNAAALLHRGQLLGAVPKSFLPNFREFYEPRQFASGARQRGGTIRLASTEAPFGVDLLVEAKDVPGFLLGTEICEDLWVPVPPSSRAALAGATVIANLSASPITVGKARTRDMLARSQSARTLSGYLYAAAGEGESTTDLAWDGQVSVFEAGAVLAESERFPRGPRLLLADLDLDLIRQERMRQTTFSDSREAEGGAPFRRLRVRLDPPDRDLGLLRPVERFPFVPADPDRLEQDCFEAYNIQVSALEQRVRTSGAKTLVIGVSGGLDSTQALLVAAQAVDRLGLGREAIRAYTMPGFGTGDATRANAMALMAVLGVRAEVLDIRPTAELMLREIGHPFGRGEPVHDVTFENVQAGLRTDYLFRLANRLDGIVVGTGDLSELGLGWCTYGVGDHMSHYNVNAGLPKTLIQHLIRWLIDTGRFAPEVGEILHRILDTEISPELVPATADAPIQSTEAKIGPYALQDFTLFHLLRYGFRPSKVAFLALHAWEDAERGAWPPHVPPDRRVSYDLPEIRRWMALFLRRFFGFSQFKRSAVPNGPKVSSGGALSPRGDWRAPSDASARAWLDELEANVPTE